VKHCGMLLLISLLALALLLSSCTEPSDQTLISVTTIPTSTTTQVDTISPNLVTMWHMDEGTGNYSI
jgi:PBP1b-binding outer membrane lipoprotein LpoB